MTAIAQAPAPDREPAPRPPAKPRLGLPRLPGQASDRGFRRALAAAAALHLLLMLGFLTAPESLTRTRLGEPGADPDGVSVEIVDMADLNSRNNVSTSASLPEPVPQLQPQPEPQPPQEPQPPEPRTQPQEPPAPQPKAEAPQPKQPAPKQAAKETPREDSEVIEAPGTPPPAEPPAETPRPTPPAKQAARPPTPPQQQQQPQRRVLDLSVPPSALNVTPRSFDPQRPPGTTRSGENDQFFLGVIRALRRTFPELRTTGIVTVKIMLNTKGNILSVTVLRTSGDPTLDQSVAFSARQASFPIPPDNSTEVDRTFLITYIYR
ncbi:MAG: TonB family protein [Hyphomicrobiaceae bacterium]|nr:TonB family protein [Hyphomicrobiaceae bacterium]